MEKIQTRPRGAPSTRGHAGSVSLHAHIPGDIASFPTQHGDGGRRDSQSPSAANLIISFEVPTVLMYEQRFKAESEAQRGKPKGTLESEIRIAMLLLGQRPPRHAGL